MKLKDRKNIHIKGFNTMDNTKMLNNNFYNHHNMHKYQLTIHHSNQIPIVFDANLDETLKIS